MPGHAALKQTEAATRRRLPADEEEEQEQQAQEKPGKKAIMKRLLAQGAVSVLPGMGGGNAEEEAPEAEGEERVSASTIREESAAPPPIPTEAETPEAEGEEENPMLAGLKEPDPRAPGGTAPSGESEGSESEGEDPRLAALKEPSPTAAGTAAAGDSASPPPLAKGHSTSLQDEIGSAVHMGIHHARVEKEVEKANNPAWYNLPQRYSNHKHGKWDLSQSRERRSAMGYEEARSHEEDLMTGRLIKEKSPKFYDLPQHAKNFASDAANNKAATAAGMVPLAGPIIKQKMKEKYDVKERDMLRGVAMTAEDEGVKKQASGQAAAVSTKINTDRFKAGVGVVTGGIGKAVPGAGQVASGVGAGVGILAGMANKKELGQVTAARAREEVRKKQGKHAEYAEYENVDDFMNIEKQRKDLVAAGKAPATAAAPAAGGSAPAVNSPEQLRRMVAHTRAETPFHKEYKRRAAEVAKEREEAANPKGPGLMTRMKNFFGRSG